MLLVLRFWILPVSALIGALLWAAARVVMGTPRRRAVREAVAVGYIVALLYVVFLMPVRGRDDHATALWASINLVPARTIVGIVQDHPGMVSWQLVGNVLLFVPLGFLLPRLSERAQRFAATAATALAVSVGIELVQLAMLLTGLSRRSVDVDDVMLNVAGACLGYLAWRGSRARREP